MNPTTIKELDEWLTANCYLYRYGIGDKFIYDGYGLDTFGSLYIWYSRERGEQETLKYFQTEAEAVEYAFNVIAADIFAKSHLVGFINDVQKEAELECELEKRGVEFRKQKVPYYSMQNLTTLIYVVGCDIDKVVDLQTKYGYKRL